MPDEKPDPPKRPEKKPAAKSRGRAALPVVTKNRLFVFLILVVCFFLTGSMLGLGLLAIFAHEPPTEMQKRFGEACLHIAMVTIGALVGLLGGKAASAERVEIGDR